MGEKDSRVGERQTASMRIKLKYPDVDTFIQKYAVNISRGGIFIATKQPKPVGTFVRFEFLLSDADQSSIIRGEGQVQWTKEYDAAQPGKAHGMGVKFFRLDGASQTVIDRALKWRAEHGTSPRAELPAQPVSSAQSIVTSSSAHAIATPPEERDTAPAPELPPDPPSQPSAPIELEPRREHTRPIAIEHGPDDPAPTGHGRSPHELTRPITMPEAEAAIAAERRGTEDLDALAAEWGLDHGKLARTLGRMRPRMAEATAELERLLLKPPKLPLPKKDEALASLRQLLAKKPGKNGTPPTE